MQVTFEDITTGMKLVPLVKKPTKVNLFRFGAVTWITHRIHFDSDFARSLGLKDVIVHGPLQTCYLIQMITDWLGENGTVGKVSYRHHRPAFAGDVLMCTGVVKDKRIEGGKGCLEIELLVENQNKEKLTSGTALVYIPVKV